MKTILTALTLLGVSAPRAVDAQENGLAWCGLDYSKVKMIGTADFNQPSQIFPGMLVAWNHLFLKEMLPKLESMAKSVKTDVTAVHDANEKANEKQIEREDGTREEKVVPTHLTESDISKMVRAYKLKEDQGLGLVFIMDRLVKLQETGCMHVVFFDIASRKVIRSQRMCEKAGGFGFRNYWFNPVKEAVKKLPKLYAEANAVK
jgi:hypothetical protein